ncbi:MAG TPA: 50S ribosomal protein L11 methyltransferase [Verrucomicrobiae bacterium]
MKTSGVSQISVQTSNECEEPVAALLERLLGVIPSAYSNEETRRSTVTAYLRVSTAKLRARQAEIQGGLAELRKLGLDPSPAEIQIAAVRREDWAESWKKYFKLIRIGSTLLIKPSWTKITPKHGQSVVTLDPGLSFGTGQHATTHFCLTQIVQQLRAAKRKKLRPGSMLDIGCGSGILAISAAKLGYSPVTAFDFDPVAVRVAMKNCRTNRVENKVAVSRKDLTKLSLSSREKYDVVCANLMAPLLIAERDRILNRLAPKGTLILAGILATEFTSVRERYESAGLQLFADKAEREWQSGAFKRKGVQ